MVIFNSPKTSILSNWIIKMKINIWKTLITYISDRYGKECTLSNAAKLTWPVLTPTPGLEVLIVPREVWHWWGFMWRSISNIFRWTVFRTSYAVQRKIYINFVFRRYLLSFKGNCFPQFHFFPDIFWGVVKYTSYKIYCVSHFKVCNSVAYRKLTILQLSFLSSSRTFHFSKRKSQTEKQSPPIPCLYSGLDNH